MSYDRADYLASRAEQRARTAIAPQEYAQFFRQAAVEQSKLMEDQHWRVYQQMLQAALETVQATRAGLLERLGGPAPMGPEQLYALRREIAHCEGAAEAFTAAISLPRQLSESAEAAAETWGKTVKSITGESENG